MRLVLAALIALMAAPAFAQTTDQSAATAAQPAQQTGPRWSVNCAGTGDLSGLVCAVFQELRVQQSGQRLVRAQTDIGAGIATPVMTLSLPHGIDFTQGAQLAIDDGATQVIAIASADQSGSYARVALDDTLAGAMRAGKVARLTLRLLNGQDLRIELGLDGFGRALDLATKATAG